MKIYYKGVFDCFRKMYQHEGVFSYWKGILPPILAETPKRATKFVCFEQYKRFFMFGSDKATPMVMSDYLRLFSHACFKLVPEIHRKLLFIYRHTP